MLHELRQRSCFAALNEIVEIRLTIFGSGLNERLIHMHRAFNECLASPLLTILPPPIHLKKCGLRKDHRIEEHLLDAAKVAEPRWQTLHIDLPSSLRSV
ncbi:MAG: hypothetical protein WBQ94_29280 [Terracidiphilus sp.]